MPKDSVTNSFIVKIKWVNDTLKITLQNIHTREVRELTTWPELFKELVRQPMNGEQITLSQEALEQLNGMPNNDHQQSERNNYDDNSDEEDDSLRSNLGEFNRSF
jgi:hypothetical protein